MNDPGPLQARVVEIAGALPEGSLGVSVYDYLSGFTWQYHGDRWFHAASTIKVAVLAAVFAAIDSGRLSTENRVHVRNRFLSAADGLPFRVPPSRDADGDVHAAIGKTMRIAGTRAAHDWLEQQPGHEPAARGHRPGGCARRPCLPRSRRDRSPARRGRRPGVRGRLQQSRHARRPGRAVTRHSRCAALQPCRVGRDDRDPVRPALRRIDRSRPAGRGAGDGARRAQDRRHLDRLPRCRAGVSFRAAAVRRRAARRESRRSHPGGQPRWLPHRARSTRPSRRRGRRRDDWDGSAASGG